MIRRQAMSHSRLNLNHYNQVSVANPARNVILHWLELVVFFFNVELVEGKDFLGDMLGSDGV